MLVGAAAGVLIAVFVTGSDDAGNAGAPTWQQVLGIAIAVVGLALEVAGLVAAWRAGWWKDLWRRPLTVLTRHQRKLLLQMVRGKAPVEPTRLPLARHTAEQLVAQGQLVGIYVGLVLVWIGNAVLDPSTGRFWFTAVLVAGYAALFALLLRQRAAAQRFLGAHPEPVPAHP